MDVEVGDLVGQQVGYHATIVASEPNGTMAAACQDALTRQGCSVSIEGADPASNCLAFNRSAVMDRGVEHTARQPSVDYSQQFSV